jgi:steroid delta-isomerase-like uncharacterized protein
MKASTVALIRNYYDSFNSQDLDRFLSLLDENVIHDINQGNTEVGKTAFSDFMKLGYFHCKERVLDLTIMADDDGSIAAAKFVVEGTYLHTVEGSPKANGQSYRLACGAFFMVKDQKITQVTTYYNLQDWINQVSS